MKYALFMLDLDLVLKETRPNDTSESKWERFNIRTCGLISSCLAKEQRCTFLQETYVCSWWKALENKYMKKNNENRLYVLKRLFLPLLKLGMSLSSHIDEFNKLIINLLNLDETFKDERKAMLLIASLPNELDHLCITLIHGEEKLSFEEVCSALLNYEIRKKDQREHRDDSVEALTMRGRSQNKKWEKRGKVTSKSILGKDECAFCHEEGHWKKGCPKLKKKDKGKSMSDACVIEHGGDSSDFEFCLVGYQTIVGFD